MRHPRSRRLSPGGTLPLILSLTLLVLLALVSAAVPPASLAQQAYDAYGYSYEERRFNGLYENADRDSINNTGDPTRLQMEWNDLFDVVYPELSQPGAWVTNFQRGTYVGQNGITYRWSYSVKLTYTGPGGPVLGYFTKEQETYVDAAGKGATPRNQPLVLPAPGP